MTAKEEILTILKEELNIITESKLDTLANRIVEKFGLENVMLLSLENSSSATFDPFELNSWSEETSKERFKDLVCCLCDLYKSDPDTYEEDFAKLEVKLSNNNYCSEEPFFGIFACNGIENHDSLDIDFGYVPFNNNMLRAEFYDGFQAPFSILVWQKDKVKNLYEIVKDTTSRLYEKIMEYIKEE